MTIRERLNQLPADVLQIHLGSWNDITILLCFYSCFFWLRAEGMVLCNRFTQGKLHLIRTRWALRSSHFGLIYKKCLRERDVVGILRLVFIFNF